MKKLYVIGICTLTLTASLIFSSSAAAANVSSKKSLTTVSSKKTAIQSYSEWKKSMVIAADQRVLKTKLTLEQQRQVSGANTDPNLRHQLSKEQLQATLATELTIGDYFVGYLNKQENMQEAVKSVAGKLSTEEVAELMLTYAHNFNKNIMQPLKSASEAAIKGALD